MRENIDWQIGCRFIFCFRVCHHNQSSFVIFIQSHQQTQECIGMGVIYFEDDKIKNGKTIKHDPTDGKGIHTIKICCEKETGCVD